LYLKWSSSPINDFYADSILATILKTELESEKTPNVSVTSQDFKELSNRISFEENLLAALNDMFDSSSIEHTESEAITINLDGKTAIIDLEGLTVKCEDEQLEQIVSTVIKQLRSLS
jgi:cleavage and polyadenylation specificity factor subunit 3